MPSIASINVQIGATITNLVSGLRSAERQLSRSGAKFERLGNSLSQSVSLPLIGIGVAGAKMASDISDNFSKIENLVGVTGQALDDLQKGVKEVSNTVGKSQNELSAALFTITSAGIKGAAALEVLESAGKASVIGLGETKDIAQATTGIMTAYADSGITAAEAINLLAKTVKAGNLEASELAPTIGKLLPVAKELKIPFAELGANIATYTRLGVPAAEATTALKAVLSNIIKPGKEAAKSLESVGLSTDGLKDSIAKNGLAATLDMIVKKYDGNSEGLARLFGSVEALTNVLGTAKGQTETYTEVLAEMKNGVDIVESGFDNASKKGPEVFRQAMVKLQNVMIDVGNVVIPFATIFAEHLSAVAQGFANLDSSTQKYIVKLGAIVAAIGPVLKVYGSTLKLVSLMASGASTAAKAFSDLAGKGLDAAKAFKKFSDVNPATATGLIVAAVGLAVLAYNELNNKLTATQKIQKTLTGVQLSASQAIVEEKIKSEQLIGTIKDVNSTYEEKKKAINELQAISPKYFGNLNAEKLNLEDVKKSQEGYIANLLKMAKVQAAQEKLIELNKALLDTSDILEESKPGMLGYASALLTSGGNANSMAGILVNKTSKAFADNKTAIEQQISALTELIATEKDYRGTSTTINTPAASPQADFITPQGPSVAPDPEAIYKAQAAIQGLSLAYIELNEPFKDLNAQGQEASAWLTAMPESMMMVQEAIEPMAFTIENLGQRIGDVTERYGALAGASAGAATAMSAAAASGETSFKKLGKSALKAAADVVRAKLMESVATYIAKSFTAFGVVGGLVAGATAGAVVGGLFNKAIGALKIPALAEGGLAYGPTLAMVGDNRNASSDPEVISPLSKLKNMLTPQQSVSDVNVHGRVALRGSDLLVILENAKQTQLRTG